MLVNCDNIKIFIYFSWKIGQSRKSGDRQIYYVPEIFPEYVSQRKAHIALLKDIHDYSDCSIICDLRGTEVLWLHIIRTVKISQQSDAAKQNEINSEILYT